MHPERYDIVLEPDLPSATFRGTVDIALVVDEPVEELVCNAAELVLEQATLTLDAGVDGREVPLTWTHDDEHERVSFALPEPLPAGATARRSASGTLNDKLRGRYRSRPQGRRRARAHHRHQPDAGHGLPARASRAGTSRTSRPCSR